MNTTPDLMDDQTALATLERYKREAETLTIERHRLEGELSSAARELQAVEAEALQLFGTTDPARIAEQLAAQRAARAAQITAFGEALASARQQLARVEAQLAQTGQDA